MKELLDRNVFVYVAAAGAGAGIQQTLWATPGASSYLAGAEFPYSKSAMEGFIGYPAEKSVSMRTAIDMAIASYLKACAGCPADKSPVGLGVTVSVATIKMHRGAHRICIAAISKQRVHGFELEIEKLDASGRAHDGELVDNYALTALLDVTDPNPNPITRYFPNEISEADFQRAIADRPWFTRAGKRSPEPVEPITLFPGAFNPVHDGHLACTNESTIFQITTRPPHKEALPVHEQLKRVAEIRRNGRDVLLLEDAGPYLEKARRFPDSTIVLGPDAVQRMLDPKWGYETIPLLKELRYLKITFNVTYRTDSTFAEATEAVPTEFLSMFREMAPTKFAGLSSTKIRAAQEKASSSSS